jgi:hypothetical protein
VYGVQLAASELLGRRLHAVGVRRICLRRKQQLGHLNQLPPPPPTHTRLLHLSTIHFDNAHT